MSEDGTLQTVGHTDVPVVASPEACELRDVLDRSATGGASW